MSTSFPDRDSLERSGGRRRWKALAPFGVACVALAVAGCFRGDDDEPATPGPGGLTDTATTAPSGPGSTPTPTGEPTETPTAAASATVSRDADAEAAAAMAAASAFFDAPHLEVLDRDACAEADPASRICVSLQSAASDVAGGLARFTAGDLDVGGFLFFMGRKADGAWGFWFGTQQAEDALESFPGSLLACGRGGPIVIRGEPSAGSEATGNAEDLAELLAEEFVLTVEGTFTAGGTIGEGWYRIATPAPGWVSALDVTDAALGDCLLHDELRGERG